MPAESIEVEAFLSSSILCRVIDVRSEAEFNHAHIPGAYNLPLFNNDERATVGTAYKKQSREHAIKLGLDIFSRKMVSMVEEVERLTEDPQIQTTSISRESESRPVTCRKTVFVHCWRGGMRSAGVAWLLDLYGFQVYTLAGGYKAFRNWVLEQFQKEFHFQILGGYTGSGKTFMLHEMKKLDALILDLEALAGHKGSSFGNIGMHTQPSQEMFENMLALELWTLTDGQTSAEGRRDNSTSPKRVIWIEDESRRIGNLNVPLPFWNKMRSAPLTFLEIPFEERLQNIIDWYGNEDKEQLIKAILRIRKRLGGLETKISIDYLQEGKVGDCFRILLKYYDKVYLAAMRKREGTENVETVKLEKVDPELNAKRLLNYNNAKQ